MEIQQTLYFETTSSVGKKPSKLVFEQLVHETIDNVLSQLGTVCRQVIYDYLEKEYALEKNNIADHIMGFSEALKQMFGGAAALLEIQMMRSLHQRVPQFKYRPEETLTFLEYMTALSHFIDTR
jgi:hypothetical protein